MLPSPLRKRDPKPKKMGAEAIKMLVGDEDGITAKATYLAKFFANRQKTRGILAAQEIKRLA